MDGQRLELPVLVRGIRHEAIIAPPQAAALKQITAEAQRTQRTQRTDSRDSTRAGPGARWNLKIRPLRSLRPLRLCGESV
jgi:hypothetical protein